MTSHGEGIAHFSDDVRDPRNIEAEERVMAYYRDIRGLPLRDRRPEHLEWDFEVLHGERWWRFDVKADKWFDATFNIPFEDHARYDNGDIRDTWGNSANIDVVVVVAVRSWRAMVLPLKRLRSVVFQEMKAGRGDDWTVFEKRNDGGYTTVGYAIPTALLWRERVFSTTMLLPPVRRDTDAA